LWVGSVRCLEAVFPPDQPLATAKVVADGYSEASRDLVVLRSGERFGIRRGSRRGSGQGIGCGLELLSRVVLRC
jgi:hypothetical protein